MIIVIVFFSFFWAGSCFGYSNQQKHKRELERKAKNSQLGGREQKMQEAQMEPPKKIRLSINIERTILD